MFTDVSIDEISLKYTSDQEYEKVLSFIDIEVFANWWCIVLIRKGKKFLFRSDDMNDKKKQMLLFMENNDIIVTANGKHYDNKIFMAIVDGQSTNDIFALSNHIITGSSMPKHMNQYKSQGKKRLAFLDVFDDMPQKPSLKELMSNLGLNIIESSVPWDKKVLTDEDKKELIDYCVNDTEALVEVYKQRLNGYVRQKINLAPMFGIHPVVCLMETNPALTGLAFGASRIVKTKMGFTNGKRQLVPDWSSTPIAYHPKPISYPAKLRKYFEENLPKEVLDFYDNTPSTELGSFDIEMFENKVRWYIGGAHSVIDEDVHYLTDNPEHPRGDEWILLLADYSQYYPNMCARFDLAPRTIKDGAKVLDESVRSRDEAKRKGLKDVANGRKLINNSFTGAADSIYHTLYDPHNIISMRCVGQLLINSLANSVYEALGSERVKIVQVNTDGIFFYIKRSLMPILEGYVEDQCKLTGLKMDIDKFKSIHQFNVNNYVAVYDNGDVKVKGGLVNQAIGVDESNSGFASNLNYPIVHTAMVEYLVNNVPVEDTIKDVEKYGSMAYLKTVKTGHTYNATHRYIGGEPFEVNKVNRVYASKNKNCGGIFKVKKNSKSRVGSINLDSLIRSKDHPLKGQKNELIWEDLVVERFIDKGKTLTKNIESLVFEDKVDKQGRRFKDVFEIKDSETKCADTSDHVGLMNGEIKDAEFDFDFYIELTKTKLGVFYK